MKPKAHLSRARSFLKSYPGRLSGSLAVLLLALSWIIWGLVQASQPLDPIPVSIISKVSFPVYFPDPSKLPSGFSLLKNSIQYSKPGVVIYVISNSLNQQVVISEQAEPAQSTIDSFLSSYIPLHATVSTADGEAQYGAMNQGKSLRSVISLPISNGPWIIATASSSLSRAEFTQVINSMIKD